MNRDKDFIGTPVDDREIRAYILEQERLRDAVQDKVLCPACGGPMTLFHWPIYLCMRCFKRRTQKQAETGRDLLDRIETTRTVKGTPPNREKLKTS